MFKQVGIEIRITRQMHVPISPHSIFGGIRYAAYLISGCIPLVSVCSGYGGDAYADANATANANDAYACTQTLYCNAKYILHCVCADMRMCAKM